MRKFLLFAMVMFTLPLFAQDFGMRLAHVYSEDGFESWDYIYPNETGTDVTCINEIDFTTDTECIDSIYYDDRGNIVKLATWQKIEGEWIYACYVEYTYDERNLKTSRTNYNHFGDKFELGGIYRYNYNEAGQMTDWALEFFNLPEYQKCVIEYNEEGQKIAEIMQQYSFETYYLENQFLTEYEYDDNNNMVRSNEFFWESDTWVIQASKVKEYDEYGNCTLAEQRTDAGTVQERRIYTYDTSISSDQVFYYPNPEDDYPQLPESKNSLLKTFEYYTQNDDMSLVYVTTYIFDYEVIGDIKDDTESVAEVAFASSVYPNPAQNFVMVESSEANYVEVVDVYGRVMFSSEMSETVKVDMNDFASGIYFVKLQANGATSVQKVIKK